METGLGNQKGPRSDPNSAIPDCVTLGKNIALSLLLLNENNVVPYVCIKSSERLKVLWDRSFFLPPEDILGSYASNILKLTICPCVSLHGWSLSCAQLFVTLWTVAHQAPLPTGFSRQEYWSGLPFSFPGDLPNLGIEPASPEAPALAGKFFTTEPPGTLLAISNYMMLWTHHTISTFKDT